MTIYELSKYQKIKHEINQIKQQLNNLDISVSNSKFTGMPHRKGIINKPTEDLILKKERLQQKLQRKQENLLDEQLKIEDFLETVEDINIRIIIRAKFIDGKTWKQIGEEQHFDRTTPYRHLEKYLKNQEEIKK